MRSGLLAAWLAGEAIVIWRIVHRDHQIPAPGVLLGISALFLGGAVVADVWPRAAGAVTLGLVGLDVAALMDVLPAGLGGQISEAEQSTGKAEGDTSG